MSCFGFIARVERDHPVALSCRLLGVSRSGYYAWRGPAGPDGRWRGRAPSPRARGDGALTSEIRRIHADSRGTYGSPRVHAEQL